MKLITCRCGHQEVLTSIPDRPFIQCSECGRRLPVRCDPAEFLGRCPKCGKLLEKDALGIHVTVCSGQPATHV